MPELVDCDHLRARNFWENTKEGLLPGLPWQSTMGRCNSAAPGQGADTDAVLRKVLSLSDVEINKRRKAGAFG